MHSTIALLATLLAGSTFAAAAPSPPANVTARAFDPSLWSTVYVSSSSFCPEDFTREWEDQGGYGYKCTDYDGASLYAKGIGCNTRVWTEPGCNGVSETLASSACYSLDYKSISLECGRGK